MFCKKCGNKLTEGQKFCNNCGEKVEEIVKEESVTVTDEVKEETTPVMPSQTETTINNNEQMNNNNFNTYSSVNTSLPSNEPKKNSNLPLIIAFILIGIIIIALIVFIVIKVTDKDDNKVGNDSPVVEKDDKDEVEDDDNKKEEEKKEIITATNYDYEKLDGYQYVIKSNRLNVTNKSMDFVAALQNMPTTTYSVLEPQLETLKQRFVSTGYIVNNAYSKTYGSTKFLVFEMTYMGQNLILFYAEHPDKTTICGSIQLKSSSYTNEDALRDMSIIINASEKSTETNDESSESFNSDISDIF